MKKLYALATAFLFAGASMAVNVTFKVNMNNVTVSANGVHVAGSFDANGSSGTAWDPSAYTMTDGDGDGVYEVTIDLEPGMYQYKFINDNDWGGVESVPAQNQVGFGLGNDNRWFYVAGAGDVPTYCFGGAADCNKVGVTFQVNMALETVSSNGVHVAGDFQGWDPAGTMMHSPDNNNFYMHLAQFDVGDSVNWKYINGDSWPDNETVPGACESGGNRYMNGIVSDTMSAVCFGGCDICQTTDVTLRVDMSNENVSADGIHVAGAFQGWDPGATEMTDADGDGIYEVTLALQPAAYPFKFVNGNAWGSEEGIPGACNVGGNREINVTTNDTTYTVCFGSCTWPCVAFPDSSNITFGVKIPAGVTVPTDADSGGVWVEGSFTNPSWQDGAIALTDNGDGTWSTTIKIGGAPEIQYKYSLGKPNTDLMEEESGDFDSLGCGIVNPVSTPNRLLNRTANDTVACNLWNSCDDCTASSVNEVLRGEGITIYPNPAKEMTTITFANDGVYNVRMFDLTGKEVFNGLSNNNRLELNTAQLETGVYIISASNETHTVTKKLIIQ